LDTPRFTRNSNGIGGIQLGFALPDSATLDQPNGVSRGYRARDRGERQNGWFVWKPQDSREIPMAVAVSS
jgi:hypothetical protein